MADRGGAKAPKGESVSPEALARLAEAEELLAERERRKTQNKLRSFHPSDKQKEILNSLRRTIAAMGANRSGKSECGAFWIACHATGIYPEYWEGKRWDRPPELVCAGVSTQTVKKTIQKKLLGDVEHSFGTGMIPRDLIIDTKPWPGLPGLVETIYVRHASGGVATIYVQTMEQGPSKFMGYEAHGIWLDEEPDRRGYDIFSECRMRTMTTGGQVLVTYTPLQGMNELCLYLLKAPPDQVHMVNITWEDAPHLTEKDRAELLASMLPHEIEARTKGIPVLRNGLIYPFPESQVLCDPFPVPDYWPHVIGMDVARSGFYAAVLLAIDKKQDFVYLINAYKKDRATREEHAKAIAAWGKGIYVACDPSANAGEADGSTTMAELLKHGLNAHNANNAVDAGIQTVYDRIESGKFKAFKGVAGPWLEEFRLYQFDEHGRVLKRKDHLMDCMRYGVMALDQARPLAWFRTQWNARHGRQYEQRSSGWQPGDAVSGY